MLFESSASSGSSTMRVARVPVLQSAISSSSSGRVGQRTRTGASHAWTRCSISASIVGSAQWMSSTTKSTGRSAARWLEELPDRPEQLLDRERLDRHAERGREARRHAVPRRVRERASFDRRLRRGVVVDDPGQGLDGLGDAART